jgi:hypothetical protein
MKHLTTTIATRLLGTAVAVLALITPAVASAQSAPSYAIGGTDQQITGTIAAVNGTWNISVADANGYTDSVELHQGTIINPTGLTLEPGMSVTIIGDADGPNFDAMEIDTPYQYDGPAPVAVYYGAGDWYPGYAEGWGPSFSLFFDIGSHRFVQRPFVGEGHGFAPQPRTPYDQPQRRFAFAAPQRVYGQQQPPPQQRAYAPPQPQQRAFAQPQPRTFAAPPAHTYNAAPRGGDGGRHR